MLRGLWRRSRANTGSYRASSRAAVLRPAVEAMERRLMLSADPIITEFMADNKHTLKDGFGNYSDWIEIFNPDSAPASLAGWYLTDTARDLRQWQFPAVSVPAGGYLMVFASGRDIRIPGQELHTNFQLAADGEYLALTKPDGITITSQYGPRYPKQVPDMSFGLAAQSSTTNLVSAGAAAGVLVPNKDMGLGWTGTGFDDRAWPIHGPTAVGFDASGVGQFAVTEGWSSSSLNNIDDAINFLSSGRGTIYNYTASVINLRDSDSQDGDFWDGTLFKGDKPGQDQNFALRITGTIHVPTSGEWTFGVNSDDGFRLKIQGANFVSTSDWGATVSGDTMTYANGRPQMDSLGVAEIEAGDHAVELYFYQGYGESEVEFFAAEGAKSSFWEGGFALVGDVDNGGLAVVGMRDQIKTDIQDAMLNKNASAYVRVPFMANDVGDLGRMVLRMRYDDGFVAYINGHEVARSANAPSTVKWNSAATSEGSDADAAVFEEFDVSEAIGFLNAGGQNVLAIQTLNASADNSDLLVWPELVASTKPTIFDQPRYLLTPTAGKINTSGTDTLGPVITDVARDVALPKDADNVVVTAKVTKALATIAGVNLHYRVHYGSEVVLPMLDDGQHGDGKAGDGVYGASIPAGASWAGQMVRYYVTASDSASRQTRWPMIPPADPDPISTRKWPEYEGFVISDPSVNTSLPTLYWFIEDPGAAMSRQGTRASMYYNGQFYDNVFCRARGGYATGGTKVDFNRGYYFEFDPNLEPVAEINLNFKGGIAMDDTWIRPVIAFETFRDAGCPASMAFPMRIQQNGNYGGVRMFIEEPDERFLERQGFYGDGSLYKTPNSDNGSIPDAGWFEKKNRDGEGTADLQALLDAIHQGDKDAVARYLLDNFDIPRFLDYQAATVLTESLDAPQKNYYLYRDTNDADNPNGSNEWMFLPWDQHLSFGKNWAIPDYQAVDPQAHPFFGDSEHPKIDGAHAWNYLIDALLDVPVIKEMYVRRLRTVLDKLLQPNGTPYANRYYENRLDQLYNQLMGDPDFVAENGDLRWAFDEIKDIYLPQKRDHLYVDHSANTSYPDYAGIPAAQAAHPAISFGAYDYNPASGNQDEEYIELKNSNSYAVDISNWRLDGGVRFEFEPGTVIPASSSIYVSPNAAAFRTRTTGPRGGQGLLVMGPYAGQLSAAGETVRLIDDGGTPVALMSYGPTPSEAQKSLRITEVMYDPAAQTGTSVPDNEQFEFVELQNISDQPLNLNGIRFTQGIGFTFGNVELGPQQYIVVVKNRTAFESRYGVGRVNIAGEYGQSLQSGLNNGGDRIQLVDAAGEEILDFRYEPTWQLGCNGLGRSLVIKDAAADASSWGDSTSWRASTYANGSPGESDPDAALGAPMVNIGHVRPEWRSTAVDSMTIVFSKPVNGFDLADVILSRDGSLNILTSSQTLTTTDHITWTLSGLSGLTAATGTYTLAITGVGAGIVDQAGNPLAAGDEERFVVDPLVPTATILPVTPDPRLNGVDAITITFSKPVMGLDLADLHLTRNGAEVLMSWQQALTTTDKKTWTLGGLSSLTSSNGTYVITLDPDGSGITDLTGSKALVGKASDAFTVGQTPPTVQVTPVADRVGPVDSMTIAFSVPVTGFDLSDLQLTREGGANVLTSAQTLTSSDGKAWVLGNLSGITGRLGSYRLLLKASGSGIVDANQTAVAADVAEDFVVYGLQVGGSVRLQRDATNADQLNVYADNDLVPDYSVRYAILPMLQIRDAAGNDRLVLDFSNGNMLPAGDVRFSSNAGGMDVLTIRGSNAGQAIRVNGSEVRFGDKAIGAVGLSRIVLEAVDGSVLDLSGTAMVSLAAGANRAIKLAGLSIANNATLDLANNALIVTATPETKQQVLAALADAIKSARGVDGKWMGVGLISSSAKVSKQTGLAVMLNDRDGKPIFGSFNGQTVTNNDILVKYTWNGDVNLDGVIDAADYFLVDSGFITQQRGYRNGDLNFDGVVDAGDYFLIDSAFIAQAGPLAGKGVSPVQELFSVAPWL